MSARNAGSRLVAAQYFTRLIPATSEMDERERDTLMGVVF
jgi:hypothetical protein